MRLEGARLDSVYGGVVPIAIQARDLAVRVETNDVSVGDPSDLTLFYEARDIRRHRSTDQRLHYDGILFGLDHLDDFGPEVGDRLRKAAPNLFKAATNWHDTVLAVGDISSLSPLRAKSEHAVDVMRVISGEEFLSDRFQISIHVASSQHAECRYAVLSSWSEPSEIVPVPPSSLRRLRRLSQAAWSPPWP